MANGPPVVHEHAQFVIGLRSVETCDDSGDEPFAVTRREREVSLLRVRDPGRNVTEPEVAFVGTVFPVRSQVPDGQKLSRSGSSKVSPSWA